MYKLKKKDETLGDNFKTFPDNGHGDNAPRVEATGPRSNQPRCGTVSAPSLRVAPLGKMIR